AFRCLVERHQRRVLTVALGLVRSREDAEELCQEAFLRAHRSLPSFAGDAQFYTWLYRIVVNLCIDHLRKRRIECVPLDEQIACDDQHVGDVDPERRVDGRELGAELQRALDELSPAHRAVLLLREIEGLSYKEIAAAVGCSIGTVMSRLFHAR